MPYGGAVCYMETPKPQLAWSFAIMFGVAAGASIALVNAGGAWPGHSICVFPMTRGSIVSCVCRILVVLYLGTLFRNPFLLFLLSFLLFPLLCSKWRVYNSWIYENPDCPLRLVTAFRGHVTVSSPPNISTAFRSSNKTRRGISHAVACLPLISPPAAAIAYQGPQP